MLARLPLMTSALLASCAALHIAPTRMIKPVAARRAVVARMDEEAESWSPSVPITANVTLAANDIKEVLTKEGFADAEATSPSAEEAVVSAEEAAKAAWLAKTYGERPSSTDKGTAAVEASPASKEVAALIAEKEELDEVLLLGYDAEKVKRLAEVEAELADAVSAAAEAMAPATEASPAATKEVAALVAEKEELDEALLLGYDAEKVKRLAEVEAELAEAGGAAPEATALSPEEAAKAAWLAARSRGW